MKLWLRIFISILMVSLTALTISSAYLINKSHLNNIDREQSRSLNEFDYIRSSITNGINLTTASEDTIRPLMDRYGEYYEKRDIRLALFLDGKILFDNTGLRTDQQKDLLTVDAKTKLVHVTEHGSGHDILVAGVLHPERQAVLLYARDITALYQTRISNIRMAMLLGVFLFLLLGSLSYLYSRWITKPVGILSKGAAAISGGDYSIRIPESKDEFKDVANAFNHMASAIEARTSELEERAKELQEFIDDLSHEMNTPMTSIQGYAEFLKNANATEKQKAQAAEHIRLQSGKIKDMFNKLMLLTITREQPPEFTEVDLTELFAELENTFQVQLTEHHITLIKETSIFTLKADRTLLLMLLTNLVKNSLQALSDGGRIRVRAYQDLDSLILEVSDNGIGIPQDKISQVTNPFFRVDKSRSRRTGGAGLGLSICRNIARLHHAELTIASREGEGTTIRIIFETPNE